MSQNNREKIIIGLKKARTSLDRIITRIEHGDQSGECFETIQQTLSVIGLLKSANVAMLDEHISEFIKRSDDKPTKRQMETMRQEVLKVVKLAQSK